MKVSIITPSFNRASLISETAESIFAQEFEDWEWIVVDDGSTDESLDILKEYEFKDNRVKVYQRDREPKGAGTCRNIAVERCTGDFLLFLDTDDLLAPFCLKQRVEAIAGDPTLAFGIFSMMMFMKEPDDLGLLWNVDKEEDDLVRFLTGDAPCQGTGTLWRTEAFKKIGMWDERLAIWQDVELHLRSILLGVKYSKYMNLRPDVFLRVTDVSLSRTGYNSPAKLRSRVNVLFRTLNLMKDSGKIQHYRGSLRQLATEILMNIIRNKAWNEFAREIRTLKFYGIFSDSEILQFVSYKFYWNVKGYKFPIVNNYFESSFDKYRIRNQNTIGKINYSQQRDR